MAYKIVSPRVGMPGDEYKPEEGVNVEALLAGGFIIETGKKNKPADNDSDTIQDNKE